MKKFFYLLLLACTCYVSAQNSEYRSIKTNSGHIRIKLADYVEEADLPFSDPGREPIIASLYGESFRFSIVTDIDSLSFYLNQNEKVFLNVKKGGYEPFVFVITNMMDLDKIEFSSDRDRNINLTYDNDIDNAYLKELRSKYPVDSVANLGKTDLEKIRAIASWVHNLWEHDGWNEPEKNDAIFILDEVKKGKRFRCVEYGIVTTACLNSIGIKARTLFLKTKDVETRESGAGHVVLEAYVNDLKKWIMIDPQMDIIPHHNGYPLNAVEFQQTITDGKSVDIWTSENGSANQYIPWIYPYLYYFSVRFDNRESVALGKIKTFHDKRELMLVPIGAKNPEIFQIHYPIDYCYYTHSVKDFYLEP